MVLFIAGILTKYPQIPNDMYKNVTILNTNLKQLKVKIVSNIDINFSNEKTCYCVNKTHIHKQRFMFSLFVSNNADVQNRKLQKRISVQHEPFLESVKQRELKLEKLRTYNLNLCLILAANEPSNDRIMPAP